MKRRDYLIGGSAVAAVIGGVGVGTGATSLLTGEPTSVSGVRLSPGVFEFLTHGVDAVAWQPLGDEKAELEVTYTDPAPDSLRLHDPDGRKLWSVTEPSGRSDAYARGLPLVGRGTWELVAEQAGDHVSLQLPVEPSFSAEQVGLSGETLHVTVGNPSDAPAWLRDIQVTVQDRYVERWRLLERIMPGDSLIFKATYPFDRYTDVAVSATSGAENEGEIATRDFV